MILKIMITNDQQFKEEILKLEEYFNMLEKENKLTEGLKYIRDIRLGWIYKAVFENQHIVGDIKKSVVFRDIEEFSDGVKFLNSIQGECFVDIVAFLPNFQKQNETVS
jgi:hypothetical protein